MSKRFVTLDDLNADHGEVTWAEFMHVVYCDDASLVLKAAEALRGGAAIPAWRRRLLAWRLEQPPRKGRRGRPPDYELASAFFAMRAQGVPYAEATARLSRKDDPFDRTVQRAAKRALDATKREIAEMFGDLEAAYRTAFGTD